MWKHRGVGRSSFLNAISKDAMLYFALITTSHFLIVVAYVSSKVGPFVLASASDVC